MLQAVIIGSIVYVILPLLGIGSFLAVLVGIGLARYLRKFPKVSERAHLYVVPE